MCSGEKDAVKEAATTPADQGLDKFPEEDDDEFCLRRDEKKRVVSKYKPSRHSR